MAVEPFRVEVPDSVLDDLRHRLRNVRLPADFAIGDWRYGVPRGYLDELIGYWRTGYDWRVHERAINAYSNFRATIDDVPIHFIHERGVGPAPIPLILTHGWPWTFWDFEKTIRPLTDPAAFGGDPGDAFDVVVPSLIARAHRVDATVVWQQDFDMTVNDGARAALATSVAGELFGDDRVIQLTQPLMGSEDFSKVLAAVPGAMIMLGACPPGIDYRTAPYNHSPAARFDDDVLGDGALLYAELALRELATQ